MIYNSGLCYELSNRGYPTIRHNELRNFTAAQVCHDVSIEPCLQPLTKNFHLELNVEDDACLDVAAKGFWGNRHQRPFLVLKCLTHMHQVAEALIYLCKLEREKQKKYEQHIREVEMGCFIEDLPYCTVMSWLRCHVSFRYIDFTSLRSKVF